MLLVSWTALVATMVVLTLVLRSRFGAITEAVRDNEERARFIGIRTLLPRAGVYALSACITAIAGVLSALNTGFVSPESMHWSLSGVALMMVVVGGTRVLWGPALGAAAYFLAKDVLGDHAQHWMAIFGTALIVVIVFAPQGLSGLLVRIVAPRSAGGNSVSPRAASRAGGAVALPSSVDPAKDLPAAAKRPLKG
jgi:branched-chain amino acid transport system permease protein